MTDANTPRLPQQKVTKLSVIGASDVRAYRIRNPLCRESDDAVSLLILAEYPCDDGFLPRKAKASGFKDEEKEPA